MASLFSGPPSIPESKLPNPPKVDDDSLSNAANAERLRRMKALGKQKSIFAGEMTGTAPILSPTLG